MKVLMPYSELQLIAKNIAHSVRNNVNNPLLFAVMRGGMTLGHLVAYELRMTIGAYYPGNKRFLHPLIPEEVIPRGFTAVFLEDVLATGRTLRIIDQHMQELAVDWVFYPSVIDAAVTATARVSCVTAKVTSDWVSFPYENYDSVVEGDRGLFRDGSSVAAKDKING